MQLTISTDDDLGDVLAQIGQMFGRELQIVDQPGVSAIRSQRRGADVSGARAAKRSPAPGRSTAVRAATRGQSAVKRPATRRTSASPASTSGASPADTTPVRAWARANGYAVNARGRLPAAVLNAYAAAHG